MRSKVMAVVLAFLVILGASGCANASDAIAQLLSGDVTGVVGKTYATKWFDFTVNSVKKVDSYAGYTAADGNQLYDVLITEKNTFDDITPMSTSDFYMDDPSFEEYVWPMDPLDDTMMPTEFDLNKNESAKYHMIYEIPQDVTKLVLMYTEVDENQKQYATFTINIDQ